MEDPIDEVMRRAALAKAPAEAEQAEANGEKTWTTEQLRDDFDVIGFAAPFVLVRRKSDGVRGTLKFRHNPRTYFAWEVTNG